MMWTALSSVCSSPAACVCVYLCVHPSIRPSLEVTSDHNALCVCVSVCACQRLSVHAPQSVRDEFFAGQLASC